MHKIYELKEKLLEELGDYSENGKFSKDDVENIKNLSGAIDHICNIVEEYDEEYSERGGSYARGGRGNSYARGRGSNARRDSRGRYSRDGGYAMANEQMIEELHGLMEDAPDEKTRQEIQRFVKKLEMM